MLTQSLATYQPPVSWLPKSQNLYCRFASLSTGLFLSLLFSSLFLYFFPSVFSHLFCVFLRSFFYNLPFILFCFKYLQFSVTSISLNSLDHRTQNLWFIFEILLRMMSTCGTSSLHNVNHPRNFHISIIL